MIVLPAGTYLRALLVDLLTLPKPYRVHFYLVRVSTGLDSPAEWVRTFFGNCHYGVYYRV